MLLDFLCSLQELFSEFKIRLIEQLGVGLNDISIQNPEVHNPISQSWIN